MIFTKEEIDFLNGLILARSREIAEATMDEGLTEAERNERVESLTSEVNVIRAMASVGEDRVDDVASRGQEIARDAGAMLSRDRYREGSTESEARLDALMARLWMQMDLVFRAEALAGIPGCGLDDSDEATFLRLRSMVSDLRGDPALTGMDVWGKLEPAFGHLDTECSVLLRVRSTGPVSNDEISEAARTLLGSVTDHGDWMVSAILPEPHMDLLRRYRLRSARYVSAMYARCILNSRHPELQEARSPGRRRRWLTRTCWRSSGSRGGASTC